MKRLLSLLFIVFCFFLRAQNPKNEVSAVVVNATTEAPIKNVFILNLNKIQSVTSDAKGNFTIAVELSDTLYLSYLGYKSIKVPITSDMMRFKGSKIVLTEISLALEKKDPFIDLTGEINIDINKSFYNPNRRFSIIGASNYGYENSNSSRRRISSIFDVMNNPFNPIYKNIQDRLLLQKIRKARLDKEISGFLVNKFDRELISSLLSNDKITIRKTLIDCNYSTIFIDTANDFQILEAIGNCYEEFKILNMKLQ